MNRRVVYVTYDGLEDPLGQSQVLPYLEGLVQRGHSFEVISFEKKPARLRARTLIKPGIHWTALRYHKTPTVPATGFDMAQGLVTASLHAIFARADLIHVRSYVPGAMVLPWVVASRTPLLFDTRALWVDEKVDVGAWPRGGWLHRVAQQFERALYRRADAVTVLTHSMQAFLREEYPERHLISAPIQVIPTCADLSTFHPAVPPDREIMARVEGTNVLTYVGSLGGWYMTREMGELYLAFRERLSPARFLVVSHHDASELRTLLGSHQDELLQVGASRERVPGLIRCAQAAVCFVRPLFSKRASAPTKLGELLGSGVPVAANIVGDMARVIADCPAGVVVDDMSATGLAAAAGALADSIATPGVSALARGVAERWFSLDDAIAAYDALYRAMPREHRGGPSIADRGWPRALEGS